MNTIADNMLLNNNLQLEQLKKTAERTGNTSNFVGKDKELYNACSQFESLFIKQMLDAMRKTVTRTTLGGEDSASSSGKDYFENMLYDDYSKKMAQTANLGIAKMMYMQLYRDEAAL